VERPIAMRYGPNTKTATITLLYPNIKVRVIDRRSKWIKVECFDYLEDVHKAGWVPKKYLKRMKRQLSLPEDRKRKLALAAEALLQDYKEDTELRIFTSIDGEDFHE
jgi:Bacterial SH3 domain